MLEYDICGLIVKNADDGIEIKGNLLVPGWGLVGNGDGNLAFYKKVSRFGIED